MPHLVARIARVAPLPIWDVTYTALIRTSRNLSPIHTNT